MSGWEGMAGSIPFWSLTRTMLLAEDASEAEISKTWYVHVGIFVQITLMVSGFFLFKWGVPALSFMYRVLTALFVDGDANDEWEMTLRRSKEVKEHQKRLNAEKEKERQAAKAAERVRRKKKVNTPRTNQILLGWKGRAVAGQCPVIYPTCGYLKSCTLNPTCRISIAGEAIKC